MYYQRYQFGPGRLTDGIKLLIIINGAVFFLGELTGISYILSGIFGIVPLDTWKHLHIWQPFTYLFLHGSMMHILMNMLVLWMFGSELEMIWGKRYFLKFYFITGIGAGILTVLMEPTSTIPVIGASGAIYGILLAYGMRFPDREVLIYFLFPIKVKYMVAIIGVIAFMSSISQQGDGIAHFTHLSGMLIAWLILRYERPGPYRRSGNDSFQSINDSIRRIKDALKRYYEMHPEKRPAAGSSSDADLRNELDSLLDKINSVGYGGLNDREKQKLYEVSNRLSTRSPRH